MIQKPKVETDLMSIRKVNNGGKTMVSFSNGILHVKRNLKNLNERQLCPLEFKPAKRTINNVRYTERCCECCLLSWIGSTHKVPSMEWRVAFPEGVSNQPRAQQLNTTVIQKTN